MENVKQWRKIKVMGARLLKLKGICVEWNESYWKREKFLSLLHNMKKKK